MLVPETGISVKASGLMPAIWQQLLVHSESKPIPDLLDKMLQNNHS